MVRTQQSIETLSDIENSMIGDTVEIVVEAVYNKEGIEYNEVSAKCFVLPDGYLGFKRFKLKIVCKTMYITRMVLIEKIRNWEKI